MAAQKSFIPRANAPNFVPGLAPANTEPEDQYVQYGYTNYHDPEICDANFNALVKALTNRYGKQGLVEDAIGHVFRCREARAAAFDRYNLYDHNHAAAIHLLDSLIEQLSILAGTNPQFKVIHKMYPPTYLADRTDKAHTFVVRSHGVEYPTSPVVFVYPPVPERVHVSPHVSPQRAHVSPQRPRSRGKTRKSRAPHVSRERSRTRSASRQRLALAAQMASTASTAANAANAANPIESTSLVNPASRTRKRGNKRGNKRSNKK